MNNSWTNKDRDILLEIITVDAELFMTINSIITFYKWTKIDWVGILIITNEYIQVIKITSSHKVRRSLKIILKSNENGMTDINCWSPDKLYLWKNEKKKKRLSELGVVKSRIICKLGK